MNEDDLLARIETRARLYGRNESRRAICAVIAALDESLPAWVVRQICAQLPPGIRRALHSPSIINSSDKRDASCRGFLTRVADRLLIDGPNAAFLARVVFEQLNAGARGKRPAAFAQMACPDLRPLLCARVESDHAAVEPAPRRTVVGWTVPGFTPVRFAGSARLDPRRAQPAYRAGPLPSRSRHWAPARTRAST